jgi:hypothetical protein
MRAGAAALVLAFLFSGCVEQTRYDTSDGSGKVAELLLKAPPEIQHRVDADLDGKVILLGYDLEPAAAAPGGKVMITWYWECKESPGAGWRIFTHLLDASGESKINKDGSGPIRKHFQPEHWRPGTIVKDPQQITIPEGWASPTMSVRIGLWKGSERMRIRKGPADKENRVKGPVIEISDHRERAAASVPRAPSAPVLDGDFAAEDAWKGALDLGAFTDTLEGTPVPFETRALVMWDDLNLYIAMEAKDDYLQSRYTNHDDELWHEDAFEVFLDPGGDRKHYYELQVSPAGVVFDSYLPRYRKNTNGWDSGTRVAVKVDGTLNDGEGGDTGWRAELAIPFAALDKGGKTPPTPGDLWRVNFFRVDATSARPRYSAWSPPMRGDFHALDRFGRVRFDAPAPTPAPAAATDAGVRGVGAPAPEVPR